MRANSPNIHLDVAVSQNGKRSHLHTRCASGAIYVTNLCHYVLCAGGCLHLHVHKEKRLSTWEIDVYVHVWVFSVHM